MTNYQDLIVWKKSMELTEAVYKLVRYLPKEETYALSDQMRRAAVSIPSNIAEGQTRDAKSEFMYFLRIANGSRAELETQLQLCARLYSFPTEELNHARELCSEVGKMIYALTNKLKTNS